MTIIDVRTPKEFEHGHIPGAINLPLFSNEERVVVGTLYKQEGRQPAILKGLEFVGPKMAAIAAQASALARQNTLYIYCWRGGMRSGSVAWLMETYGLRVFTLKGGYKSFRRYVLDSFDKPCKLLVLAGKTGSGKTQVLSQLELMGQQVADLERMAAHKGSAFGALGEAAQPTQEQFENELSLVLQRADPSRPVWVEDESRLIGKKVIPEGLWTQMREAETLYLQLPFSERVEYLVQAYGQFPKEALRESIQKITKRLGPQHAQKALQALDNDDLHTTCGICLQYYDRSYDYGVNQRPAGTVKHLSFNHLSSQAIAAELVSYVQQHQHDRY